MFKLHKPQLSGSIHSGHFMVSRLDDDDDDNNDAGDDSSESERDNANSVEIDVNNPDSVVDANNLSIPYRVESPSTKNEQLASWNDLDRPAKHSQKQNQYLTYYTNTSSIFNAEDARVNGASTSPQNVVTSTTVESGTLSSLHHNKNVMADRFSIAGSAVALTSKRGSSTSTSAVHNENNREFLASRGFNGHLSQQQQQLDTLQDHHHHNSSSSAKHMQLSHGHAHAVTIDTTLTKLLEWMSLYYSSKLTSPKWKSFKGLKLRLKCKIRLNNLIWRAWFLQCIRGRRPPGCQFTAPAETDVHKKSETIVLEGKYWKRKEKAIVDEYKKWRIFHKQKSQIHCFRPSSFDWDSRVSNLASSSMYGSECHFYPDYDMNTYYNLDDDLPPTLEELEQREPENYYQSSLQSQLTMRIIEPPQPQPQQQQQTSTLPAHPPQQQQQQNIQTQQHLAQTQVPRSSTNHHHQAISLKTERPSLISTGTSNGTEHLQPEPLSVQTNFSHPHHQQQPLQLNQRPPPPLSFNLETNPLYQQIHGQLQHQQHPPSHHVNNSQQQQQQHQQEQEHSVISLSQDLCQLGGGGGAGTFGGGRNEQRRVCHINAEQKRRCNIKNGFDTLRSILPSINQNVNVKISKASMLQKAAVYISTLTAEQKQQAEEQAMLRQQIENLKQAIRAYQCQLPASGGAVGCQGSSQSREMLQDYVRRRTLENWKFWIFSLLIEPLFETYYSSVSTTSLEDACKTIFTWLDRSCGLNSLRKDALESLTFLSTSTNILNTPQTLPTEAVDAVRYHTSVAVAAPTSGSNPSHATAMITASGQSAMIAATTAHRQLQLQANPSQQAHQPTAASMQAHPIRTIW